MWIYQAPEENHAPHKWYIVILSMEDILHHLIGSFPITDKVLYILGG